MYCKNIYYVKDIFVVVASDSPSRPFLPVYFFLSSFVAVCFLTARSVSRCPVCFLSLCPVEMPECCIVFDTPGVFRIHVFCITTASVGVVFRARVCRFQSTCGPCFRADVGRVSEQVRLFCSQSFYFLQRCTLARQARCTWSEYQSDSLNDYPVCACRRCCLSPVSTFAFHSVWPTTS